MQEKPASTERVNPASATPMPPLKYEAAPCPQCGACGEEEANELCQQVQDQTGEYYCDGEFDANGVSIQPTAESLAAQERWYEEQGRVDG